VRSRIPADRRQLKITLSKDDAVALKRWAARDGLSSGSVARSIIKRRLLLTAASALSARILARPARDEDAPHGAAGDGSAFHVWLDEDDYGELQRLSRLEGVCSSRGARWMLEAYVRARRQQEGINERTNERTNANRLTGSAWNETLSRCGLVDLDVIAQPRRCLTSR